MKDPFIESFKEEFKKAIFVLLPDNDKDFKEFARKALNSGMLTQRCYHKDGSYHLVDARKSNCGSLDVDFLACAERDGWTPKLWTKKWKEEYGEESK